MTMSAKLSTYNLGNSVCLLSLNQRIRWNKKRYEKTTIGKFYIKVWDMKKRFTASKYQ